MSRLLIVEDNAELAENLGEILESQGHEVLVVGTADEALGLCASERFKGILTDNRLPGRSGIELIEALRHNADPTPIVLMTGFANSVEAQRAEELGALAVLLKPLEFEQLFGLVQAFARPKRQVLVLEDNVALADNLREALAQAGFEPLVAHNVRDALSLHQLPRVAIVDYRLPDGSGLEAARRLAARDPELQVILVTGHRQEAQRDTQARPAPFLRKTLDKPVPLDTLLSTLEKATLASLAAAL